MPDVRRHSVVIVPVGFRGRTDSGRHQPRWRAAGRSAPPASWRRRRTALRRRATEHARAITFKLKKSGKASGVVSSTEDPAFTDCVAAVPVKIQKKKNGGGWKTVASTTTDDTGSYTTKIKGKPGKYRALAPKVSLGDPVTDICLKAKSATRTIK